MDTSVLVLLIFMLKSKSLLDYANLFSPKEYEKNDKIILKNFQYLKRLRWKHFALFGKCKKFGWTKISYI